MTPDNCPDCGAKLSPEMLACPNCPRSFPEDDGPVGAGNPLKQSRYWKFVLPVAFFSIIGATVWYLGIGLMRLGEDNSKGEQINVLADKTKAPNPEAAEGGASGGSGAEAASDAHASSAGASAGKPTDEDGMVVISHVDENGTPITDARGKGADFARPAPIPGGVQVTAAAPKALKEWKLRGTIYDLTTLRPLAGCDMLFTDESTNRSIKTRTDSTGRYRTIVPPLEGGSGYSVSIEKGGYSSNYLDPGTEREREAGRHRLLSRAAALSAASTSSRNSALADSRPT
jgi:hypothetical protein